MKRNPKSLIVLNILSLCTVAIPGIVLGIRLLRMAAVSGDDRYLVGLSFGVFVIMIAAAIAALFVYSTLIFLKGYFRKVPQLLAGVLTCFCAVVADTVTHGRFSELAMSMRLAIIYLNAIAVIMMMGSALAALTWDKNLNSTLQQ